MNTGFDMKTNWMCVVLLCMLLAACTKEPVQPAHIEVQWTRAINLPESTQIQQIAVGASNVYFITFGLDGYHLVSVDQNNRVLETRAITYKGPIYLTRDFFVQAYQSGHAQSDSTLVEFHSLELNKAAPMVVVNSKVFWTTATDGFNSSDLRLTSQPLTNNTYGMVLRHGPIASTAVDVASISIINNAILISNKASVGTFRAESTPYGNNDWAVALKDRFLIQMPSSMYVYQPGGSISAVPDVPPNYQGLSVDDFVFNDSLLLKPGGYDKNYYLASPLDQGNGWEPIVTNDLLPSCTLNGFLAQRSNDGSLDLIKVDRKAGSLVKFKSDYLKGIDSPDITAAYYFNNQVFVVLGNSVYSKPMSAILAN